MNWKNSDFQIFYHILGNCHTPVEGLRVLYELRQDRAFSIKSSLAESKRSEAKVLTSKKILEDNDDTLAQRMTALCNIEEQTARSEIAQPCYDAALHELSFINYLIESLESKVGAVTASMFQLIQPVENAYDLVVRSHSDISLYGKPSTELLNEARNSPYREHVLKAVFALMENLSSCDPNDRINFLAMSKNAILDKSGIVSAVGSPVLNLDTVDFPDLEKLKCPDFPLLITNQNS